MPGKRIDIIIINSKDFEKITKMLDVEGIEYFTPIARYG